MNNQQGKELEIVSNSLNQPVMLMEAEFQKRLIKLLLDDLDFSSQIIDIIDLEYFDAHMNKFLVGYILKYYNKYALVPEYETLESIIFEKETDEILKEKLIEYTRLLKSLTIKDSDYIKEVSLKFCKKQSLKNGLLSAVKIWEKGDYDNISKIINDALKLGEPKSNGHNYIKDVEKRLIKNHRNPITCLKGLDSKIGGGLAGGEMGIVLAATGGGKSMMLVKFAQSAFEAGKTAVYYSLELKEEAIGNRFDAALNGINLGEILDYPDVIREKTLELMNAGGNLIIKEFSTGSASVETIKSHLQSLKLEGIEPDVVFIDYADIMKPSSSFTERRHSLTSIYEAIRGMAMDMDIPIWTASQANRDAINSDKFDLSVISESLGKAQTADIIIGIARPDELKSQKKASLMLLKNRNGEDGYVLPMYFDTSKIDIRIEEQESIAKLGIKGLNLEKQIRENNIDE